MTTRIGTFNHPSARGDAFRASQSRAACRKSQMKGETAATTAADSIFSIREM